MPEQTVFAMSSVKILDLGVDRLTLK